MQPKRANLPRTPHYRRRLRPNLSAGRAPHQRMPRQDLCAPRQASPCQDQEPPDIEPIPFCFSLLVCVSEGDRDIPTISRAADVLSCEVLWFHDRHLAEPASATVRITPRPAKKRK